MAIITDASSLLGLVLEDEDARYAQSVIETVAEQGAVVPCLFWFEVRNALVVSERRGRIAPQATETFLNGLHDLPFEYEGLPSDPHVIELARRYELSVYDATYLELAGRRKLALATRDRRLAAAAERAGVALHGE